MGDIDGGTISLRRPRAVPASTPQLGQFTANLRREDVLHVLRGDLKALRADIGVEQHGDVAANPSASMVGSTAALAHEEPRADAGGA